MQKSKGGLGGLGAGVRVSGLGGRGLPRAWWHRCAVCSWRSADEKTRKNTRQRMTIVWIIGNFRFQRAGCGDALVIKCRNCGLPGKAAGARFISRNENTILWIFGRSSGPQPKSTRFNVAVRGIMINKFAVSLLAAALVAGVVRAEPAGPTITIQADQPGAKINPAMWGVFFEDINFGADGGLYAELVKNRGFEFPDPLMAGSRSVLRWPRAN